MIVQICDGMSVEDLRCLFHLALGMTWDGPQRDTLVAYAHGIADQLLPRELPHATTARSL